MPKEKKKIPAMEAQLEGGKEISICGGKWTLVKGLLLENCMPETNQEWLYNSQQLNKKININNASSSRAQGYVSKITSIQQSLRFLCV